MTVGQLIDLLCRVPNYYEVQMVDCVPITRMTIGQQVVYISDYKEDVSELEVED